MSTSKTSEPGVVYTKSWTVDLVLDLAGYEAGRNLVDAVAVEPSCGSGEFLQAMAERLSASCRSQGRSIWECASSIIAFDLDDRAVRESRMRVASVLVELGWNRVLSEELAGGWIRCSDFLLDGELDLVALGGGVDFVIGNPPYVRLEMIEQTAMKVYRKRYRTMSGRSDLYVGFYERALNMLASNGVCSFVCADRWMLNQYGARLREMISSGAYSVEAVVDLYGADAFHSEVLAYPAITTVRRTQEQGRVVVAKVECTPSLEGVKSLTAAVKSVRMSAAVKSLEDRSTSSEHSAVRHVVVDEWFRGSDPWPNASPGRLKLLYDLERRFPTLQDAETGTKVGIGVATGADRVFLTRDASVVERNRLLPLAMAGDTRSGTLNWSGTYLVNPWERNGKLADLGTYPKLGAYLGAAREALSKRHVARKNPSRWYKTIDKVDYALVCREKLLIPDIKNVAHPVLDRGEYYPHHNLYHITSETWDLSVLGGILLSGVCQFFIECYAVKMNNGYLRFQAQYLRRIRVPRPEEIAPDQAERLRRAFSQRDVNLATEVALEVYGIDKVPV